MSRPPLSGRRTLFIFALSLVARIVFPISFAMLFCRLLFGAPSPAWRITAAFALGLAATLATGLAARDFRGLWQMPLSGLALAGLALAGALLKVCFDREPHHLSPYEIAVALGGLAVFAAGCLLLRKKARRVRPDSTRPKGPAIP